MRGVPPGALRIRRHLTWFVLSKALSILAAKLGRTVYFLLSQERVFEMDRFFGDKQRKR